MSAADIDPGPHDAIPVGMYTETLARLYFRQGYVDEALRIYRHLAAERPHDEHLQEQLRVLTQQLASTPEPPPRRPGTGGAAAGLETSRRRHPMQPVITELERWLGYLQRHPPHRR
jgi:hypothetical protein